MFSVTAEDEGSGARAGVLRTAHGDLETPAFLPVATKGVVKTLTPEELRAIGVGGIIVNSFHFLLRGKKAVAAAGGIHEFMRWSRVIFTDCGGFQLVRKDFSFRLSDEGLHFKLPDGEAYTLDPLESVRLQERLGSDVAFALDDCPPLESGQKRVLLSMERTRSWARRSLSAREYSDMLLFGITQGGRDPRLREDHARAVGKLGFDGFGIGGLGLGEPKKTTIAMTEASVRGLPRESPKHLLGIGSPKDLLNFVTIGVDIFDSAFPARNARHGTFFACGASHDIRKRRFEGVVKPLDESCECQACREFTTGYIHHLYREKEMLAMRLLSIHNLAQVEDMMSRVRTSLVEGRFPDL